MEREVSIAVELGVALISVAALIGIVWFTVFMGKGMANNVSVEASDALYRSQVATLESIMEKGEEEEMPIAAAYSMLRTYSSYIPEFICNNPKCIADREKIDKESLTLSEGDSICVLQHLDIGMVRIKIEESIKGGYKVTLTPITPIVN